MSAEAGSRSRGRTGFHRPPSREPMLSLSQEELVPLCLENREDAWEEFLRRYANLIYSTILKVGLPEDEQEEAFQATIIAIHKQLARLQTPGSLVSWIIGIAWRQSVNRIRARSRETRVEEVTDPILQRSLDPPAAAALPDEERIELERAWQAREALALLPERCRRLLEYLFFEDPPPEYAEIARREDMPVGSLGPTRARCLERMRRVFEDRGWTQ